MLMRALSAVVFSTGVAAASTGELDTAVVRAALASEAPIAISQRQAVSDAALAYWRSFDSRLPRNPPAARDWLEDEIRSNDTDRIGRIINTPEYALRQLDRHVTECLGILEFLDDGIGRSPLRELYLWTKSLRCYGNPGGLLIYLQQAGLSNGRYDGAFSLQHFSFFHDLVTGDLSNTIEAEGTP